MDKQIKDLTDLELAQVSVQVAQNVGQAYQNFINLNNQLEALNMEIKKRQDVSKNLSEIQQND